MHIDPQKSRLALFKLASVSFRPEYEQESPGKKWRGRVARALSTPLVGLSGAAAGGIGLGLAGLLTGGYLGYHHGHPSQLPLPGIDPPGGQYGLNLDVHSPSQAYSTGEMGTLSGRLPKFDELIDKIMQRMGTSTVNQLGGPEKLTGLAGGAAAGSGLGTLAGLIGGGVGGSYLGWRAGGGDKPKELKRLVMEGKPTER